LFHGAQIGKHPDSQLAVVLDLHYTMVVEILLIKTLEERGL
jgi:hypothetical protein